MASIELLLQNEFVRFFLILAAALVGANVVYFILRHTLHNFAKKTKTDLDDIVLEVVTKPIYIGATIAGLFFAVRSLTALSPYSLWMDILFFISIVLLAAFTVSKLATTAVAKWMHVKKGFEKTPILVNKIVSAVIYLLAILTILGHFNVEITPLVAALGIGGIAVGLALQSTLTNFIAGLHIISDQPLRVGDYVEINGSDVKGYVEDIGWRSTRIRTLPNNFVIVPNGKLADSTLINYSMPVDEQAALVQVGVAYGSDLKNVERVTVDVAKKIQKIVQGAIPEFEPFIRYHTFGDSNINFTVILRVKTFVDQYLVKHEFIKALKEAYDNEGIEISWPVRKIYKAD